MTGVLLMNVGTPAAPTTAAVRRYLRQFLADARVLDLPAWRRWLLLNVCILPFRSRRSAAAYRKIWTAAGSPLLVHSRAFAEALQQRLGTAWVVALAMQYGEPSVAGALRRFAVRGIQRIVLFPLFPQYAAATTGASLAEVYRVARQAWDVPLFRVVPPFYEGKGFCRAIAGGVNAVLRDAEPEHLLFSFHGLPTRYVARSRTVSDYPADCQATARSIAECLALSADRWSVAFQSRLGREPWLQPSTEEHIRILATKGVKRLAVCCPSFVADCLETVEEIGLRARETFLAHGGEAFTLVPALNADPAWVEAAAELVSQVA